MRSFIVSNGVILVAVLSLATSASAQADGPIDPGADVPLEKPTDAQPADGEEQSDPTLFEGENPGEEEDPDSPGIDLVGEPAVNKKAAPMRPPGYPQEVYYRPLTLPGGMGQASFEYRFKIAPQGDGILALNYAINSQLQLGLRYGVGSLTDDGYKTGKTFSIDAEYTIFSWLAAQLSVPMLADPYTVAVTLGVPMKFLFARKKLRFDLGRDLVTFRTNRDYYPRLGDAAVTDQQVVDDMTNTILDQGEIRIAGSIIYQHDVKIAAEARLGLTLADFELTSDSPYQLELGGTYAHSQSLDFGGFVGFSDLGTVGDTFGLSVFARFRIGG